MRSLRRRSLRATAFLGCLAVLAAAPARGLAAAVESYPTWSSGGDLGADHEAGAALAQAAKKSLLTAGLLGGVVGFGTGQFYSRRWISGAAFLIVDSVLAAYLAKVARDGDDDGSAETIGEAAAAGAAEVLAVALLATALTTSHLVQAVWGPLAARQHNRELEQQTAQGWRLGLGVDLDTVRFAASYRY